MTRATVVVLSSYNIVTHSGAGCTQYTITVSQSDSSQHYMWFLFHFVTVMTLGFSIMVKHS